MQENYYLRGFPTARGKNMMDPKLINHVEGSVHDDCVTCIENNNQTELLNGLRPVTIGFIMDNLYKDLIHT